ncbi:MAG: B12-binding domain-containing radical SAM protein [Candidatus Omnitrophica bacterium]|nr:B12-binding domain-containing radical SAM protein [Candidatus Omnitrophota bacterium]MBU0897492.1 B12-binding domain-containing radical SAM protein [Candidatus Omnitrophota bacterium]MBU1134854.1 B12-binding domain-containing radical SAM protein [Candidatus Omnitrophota bacterium]MBU1809660.1 B12-binding domain-containing radical SAM protein [Candidatus Omnitrophota bacterium]
MRVALIFNPFKYKVHEENLKVVQKYFGMFPPLSLAWVAAIAERAGHEVIIIDARTLDSSKEDVLDRLKEFKPDILGFMMTTYMFPETLEWIKFLKKNLDIPVLIGGYNLRVYPRESLSHPQIDFGCLKQAINTVPQLLTELESGRRNFSEVVGLIYKENGQVKINPPDPEPIDFNSFPHPSRHLLPNHLYAEFPTQRKNFTVMVTSLGCPYQCGFCEAGGTLYSPRTPQVVVDEMQECYTKYNIREIDIFDYEFTAIRKRVEEICNKIIEKGLDIDWACRSRIDGVDGKLLDKMKQAGCRRIYFGIESGCQEILDKVNKGITLKQIREIIHLTKSKGIQALGFFLVGAPGETMNTFKQTFEFAKELDLDYVQFSKCLAKPLTPLWKEMVEKTGKDYWQNWVLGKETDRQLPRPWTELSNNQIHCLAKWAYVRYYLHPVKLLKSILTVRSWGEFKRKFFAFSDMLFRQENRPVEDKKFKAYSGY